MFTRNYDNIITFRQLCNTNAGYMGTAGYGDGELSVKNWNNALVDSAFSGYLPFQNFSAYKNGVSTWDGGSPSNLICGYDENEITYDDYKIASVPSLNYVSHSFGSRVYNEETNTFSREYTKTYNNASSNTITINCIGVAYCYTGTNSSNVAILVFKEKLPEPVEIPAQASITLKFKTTVTGNPNKPMEASVSVE
jgi:hypothetical protein